MNTFLYAQKIIVSQFDYSKKTRQASIYFFSLKILNLPWFISELISAYLQIITQYLLTGLSSKSGGDFYGVI
jgi:hypothetical protein